MRYTIPLKVRRNIELQASPPDWLDHMQDHGIDVDPDSPNYEPCWVWTGSVGNAGYGQVKMSGKTYNTHRLVWWILSRKHDELEPIPQPGKARSQDGDILDHLCHNRLCSNPTHLEKISQSENVIRGERWNT
jgi:hypothetical protein